MTATLAPLATLNRQQIRRERIRCCMLHYQCVHILLSLCKKLLFNELGVQVTEKKGMQWCCIPLYATPLCVSSFV